MDVYARLDPGKASDPVRSAADDAHEELDTSSTSVPSDVFARVAHELKTPITVAKGFALTLRDSLEDLDPATIKRCCDAIVRGLTSADALVSSLAQTRAVETGEVTLTLGRYDIGEFVTETVRDLELLISPHHVTIAVLSEGEGWFDRPKVRQILTNLLSNAAKFSPPQAPILVEVCCDGESMEVAVIDRGPGIPPDRMNELFGKYQRLGSEVKGTGLGLYISRGIARAHGGDLTAESDGNNGSRFALTIPTEPPRTVSLHSADAEDVGA